MSTRITPSTPNKGAAIERAAFKSFFDRLLKEANDRDKAGGPAFQPPQFYITKARRFAMTRVERLLKKGGLGKR